MTNRRRQKLDFSPMRLDLKLVRGDTWKLALVIATPESASTETPIGIDLGDSTWNAEIRVADAQGELPDNAPVFAAFNVDSSQQGSGKLFFSLDPAITENAVVGTFTYWYDIEQRRFGEHATPVQGRITVVADVTQVGE
jgi:hypothetical protein